MDSRRCPLFGRLQRQWTLLCYLYTNLLFYVIQVLISSSDGRPFGHNRHGPKFGGLCPFWEGELDPDVTQCGVGRGLPCTKWHLDPSSRLGTIGMGRKLGAVPLWGEDLGSQLTQCSQGRDLPACQVSSWSVEPFGHNTPTSQSGQDRQERQRSDSIGLTVLQTVAQKPQNL